MMRFSHVFIGAFIGMLFFLPGFAAENKTIDSLDALLDKVRQESQTSSAINEQREAEFLAAKDQQQRLLKTAKRELSTEEKRSETLNSDFENNEKKIAELEKRLDLKVSSFGELFGVVRQVSDDMTGILENSIISAQLTHRDVLTAELAQRKALPSIDELDQLWLTLLEEMTESGKVVQFSAPVISSDGIEQQREVTRVGVFNAFSDGKYLRYLPETERLVELARQPATRYQEMASLFEKSHGSGYDVIGLDPSRGAILSVLVQTPNFMERIQQGGIIAYVIIGVGLLGLLLLMERFVFLTLTGRAVNKQLKSEELNIKNPLGRILQHFRENPQQETETLQLKLEEAVLKELPKIERGLSSIGVLAAIAPLLGLLGTVTGMIETFQSITLFGTGDPKYMSSGISQALVTTELGLIVAVPLVLLLSFLTGKGNRLVQVLDEQSAGVVARLVEERNNANNTNTGVDNNAA